MCLISIAPKGTPKYTDEVVEFIENGFHANSSGSGFMYKKEGEPFVYIKKGYFDLEKLLADIKAADLKDEDELVIHHRIRTSGLANNLNTHPFVISHKHDDVITLDGKVNKPCLAHNGVFNLSYYEDLNPDFSDTYAFTRYIMSNKHILNLFKEESKIFELIADRFMGYNKIVLLFPDRDLVMYGKFEEHNGYYHSNGGYKNRYIRNRGGIESTCSVPYQRTLEEKKKLGPKNTMNSLDESINSSQKTVYTPSLQTNKYFGNGLVKNGSIINSGIRLDGSIIRINECNYNHFYYVSKNETIPHIPTNIYSFSNNFEDFNENKEQHYNMLWVTSSYGILKTEKEILSKYWFYPKQEYSKIYNDYIHLHDKVGCLSNRSAKKLNKYLTLKLNKLLNSKNGNKISNSLFVTYKRLNEVISLKALFMFYEYWRNEYKLDEIYVVNVTNKDLRKMINDTYKTIEIIDTKAEVIEDAFPIDDPSLKILVNVHND